MAIYLAGPMRKLPEFNYPAFHEAAKRWRAAGHEIISPAEQFSGDTSLAFPTYIHHDLKLILSDEVQAVAVLPGWQNSEGATLEVSVARALAKPIYDARYPATLTLYSETIAEEAQRLVGGDRHDAYGDAYADFQSVGLVWEGLVLAASGHDIDFSPALVGLMMSGLKLRREAAQDKRDSRVDAIGYLLCVDQIRGREKANGKQQNTG